MRAKKVTELAKALADIKGKCGSAMGGAGRHNRTWQGHQGGGHYAQKISALFRDEDFSARFCLKQHTPVSKTSRGTDG
jgi:hypothetical protein